jgi:hypothetical protein
MFLLVLEILFVTLVAVFVISQILAPLLEGRKLFPLFRPSYTKKERDLRDKLEDVAQKEVEAELESELENREAKLKSKQSRKS